MIYFWYRSQGCMVATANPFSYLYGHTTHPVHAGRRGWCILALGVAHYTFLVSFFIIWVKFRGARRALKIKIAQCSIIRRQRGQTTHCGSSLTINLSATDAEAHGRCVQP